MESKDMQERIKKLPRAIRDYITGLEIDVRACKKSLAERTETNTVWGWEDATEYGNACGYIPDDEIVRFYQDKTKRVYIDIRRMKSGRLRISASNGLVLGFTASNMATVSVDREGEWIE